MQVSSADYGALDWNNVCTIAARTTQGTTNASQSTWRTESQQIVGNEQKHCIRLLILLFTNSCRTACAWHLAARLASASCQPLGQGRLLPGQLLLQRNNV